VSAVCCGMRNQPSKQPSKSGFRPFSNGTEYQDWLDRNCDRCQRRKLDGDYIPKRGNCKLENALSYACVCDGTIPQDVAEQIGVITRILPKSRGSMKVISPVCRQRLSVEELNQMAQAGRRLSKKPRRRKIVGELLWPEMR